MVKHIYFHLILMMCVIYVLCYVENDGDKEFGSKNASTKVLSRRKRFLVFPDGSSFQMVFCTQTHGYLQVGDIVWFGSTAALAWQLPTDPNLFGFLKDKKFNQGNRRMDTTRHIYYIDEFGKVISKVPYHKRLIVNPAFAKRSVDMTKNKTINLSIKDMHERSRNMNYWHNLHKTSVEFHREGRLSLYGKLEKWFQGLGWNGKECVLKMLCESGKGRRKQGSFLGEIIRATFIFPPGHGLHSEYNEYDEAHGTHDDCSKLYPECDFTHETDQQ